MHRNLRGVSIAPFLKCQTGLPCLRVLLIRLSCISTSDSLVHHDYSGTQMPVSDVKIQRNADEIHDQQHTPGRIFPEDTEYRLAKLALTQYRSMYGDMQVRIGFVVPDKSDKWEKSLWRMKLGALVKRIREGKMYSNMWLDLRSIGFDFNYRKLNFKCETIYFALLLYKNIYSNILVPYRFIVPSFCDRWPEETWGMRLGTIVGRIRSGQSTILYSRKELESIGFDYKAQANVYGYDLVKPALLRYKEIYGNMLVPSSFVVPENRDQWPNKMWNMKLGRIVHAIRTRDDYKDMRDELISLGFNYEPQRLAFGFNLLSTALQSYKNIYDNLLVPAAFIIPKGHDGWPRETWDIKLGSVVQGIRMRNDYKDHRAALISMGFQYKRLRIVHSFDLIKLAILKYKETYGNLNIQLSFKIPFNDPLWPEEIRGMWLGRKVYLITVGKSYCHMKEEFLSLGLQYKTKIIYEISK